MIKTNTLFWVAISQIIGISIYYSLEHEPSITLTIILLIISVVLTYSFRRFTFLLLFIAIGFSVSKLKTELLSSDKLHKQQYMHNIQAKVLYIEPENKSIRITVNTIEKNQKLVLTSKIRNQTKILAGDIITLSGILYKPSAPISEYSYDVLRNSYYNNIFAFGVITKKIQINTANQNSSFTIQINKLKNYIYYNIKNHLTEKNANIASAILIGTRRAINKKTAQNIKLTGISHLFAISGMHLNIIAGILIFTIRTIMSCFEKIALKYDTKKIASFIAFPLTSFYLILSGLQTSTQRAFTMLTIILFSNISYRSYSSERAIVLALIIMLFIEPEELLNPSLQLSFITVLALIKCNIKLHAIPLHRYIILFFSFLQTSIIATIATIPFVAQHFNIVSLYGVLTNIIAIPTVVYLIIPFGILYIFSIPFHLERIFSVPLEFSTNLLSSTIDYFAKNLSYSVIFHSFSGILLFPIIIIIWHINSKTKYSLLLISLSIIFIITQMYTSQTPDILINKSTIAFKENNHLYFLQKRKMYKTPKIWNLQNGDTDLQFLDKKNNKYCATDVCVYRKQNNEIYIIQKNLQNKKILIYQDNKLINRYSVANGTYSIWINHENIKVKLSLKDRPWHTSYIKK